MKRLAYLFLLVALAALAGTAAAQFARVGQARGFKLVDYHPARAGEQQIKTLLTGSEAQMSSNGMVLLKEPRIENYTEEGKLEWIATAADAVANIFTHSASGTNRVVFQTADGAVSVQGRGFLWQQTNSTLILSNDALTRIDRTIYTNASILP